MIINQPTVINNIYYLGRQNNIKVSDIETAAGLSSGYLSKLKSDEKKSVPSAEALVNIANLLKTSVDTLLTVDLSEITPEEDYVLKFIDKAIKLSGTHDAYWTRLAYKQLLQQVEYPAGQVDHPMFENDGYQLTYISAFHANEKVELDKDSFMLDLGFGSKLYLMSVTIEKDDSCEHELELYIYTDRELKPLCTSLMGGPDYIFLHKMNNLYDAATNACGRVRLDSKVKRAIDIFMQDDDDLPF